MIRLDKKKQEDWEELSEEERLTDVLMKIIESKGLRKKLMITPIETPMQEDRNESVVSGGANTLTQESAN